MIYFQEIQYSANKIVFLAFCQVNIRKSAQFLARINLKVNWTLNFRLRTAAEAGHRWNHISWSSSVERRILQNENRIHNYFGKRMIIHYFSFNLMQFPFCFRTETWENLEILNAHPSSDLPEWRCIASPEENKITETCCFNKRRLLWIKRISLVIK